VDRSGIRNIGLMAHADAGKTTTVQRLLTLAASRGQQDVADLDGSQAPLSSVAAALEWRDHTVHLVSPSLQVGMAVDVERDLRVFDAAIAIFSGVEGVEPCSEVFWHQADRLHVPRLAFINKLDQGVADFHRVVDMVKLRLSANVLLVHLPITQGSRFVGFVDLVSWDAKMFRDPRGDGLDACEVVEIPEFMRQEAAIHREALIDTLVEFDEGIGERYLADDDIPEEVVRAAIRRATVSFELVPVLAGAAFVGHGMSALLDAVVDYLPSPLDVAPIEGHHPSGADDVLVREPDVDEDFAALVFRVAQARDGGGTGLARVFSGRLHVGDEILVSNRGLRGAVTGLWRPREDGGEPIDQAAAGDIVALSGIKDLRAGDTLCDAASPVVLERLDFGEPVLSVSVTLRQEGASDELVSALAALSLADPSFRYHVSGEASGARLSGMDELHLETLVGRLRREWGIDLDMGCPRVAYRETFASAGSTIGEASGVRVVLEVTPADRGEGVLVTVEASEHMPTERRDALRRGVEAGVHRGGVHGFPFTDLIFRVTDVVAAADAELASYSEAARRAVSRASARVESVVLEPVMQADIIVPDGFLGDVLGDLTSRRGHVKRIESRGNIRAVSAHAPLSELNAYAARVRSLAGGLGNVMMQFAGYERLPIELAEQIAAAN
jgi:elongation factor G